MTELTPDKRRETLLANIVYGEDTDIDPTNRRLETILKAIWQSTPLSMEAHNRLETLLLAILNGDASTDMVPQNRLEQILIAKINGDEVEFEPQDRIEALLLEWIAGVMKTVSGNPIVVADAIAGNARGLVVEIEPSQDLHGYDYPWSGGSGKNLFDIDNPLFTAVNTSAFTNYGSKVEDGKVYNGGRSGLASGSGITIPVVEGETYTVSMTISGENASYESRAITLNQDNTWASNSVLYQSQSASTGKKTFTVTIPSGYTHLFVTAYSATKYGSYETEVQIEKGSTATAWTPYSNICPISGMDSVEVVRTGYNLFNKNASDVKTGKYLDADGVEQSVVNSNITGYIPVVPSQQIYIGDTASSSVSRYRAWYDADKNLISTARVPYTGSAYANVITPPSNARYIRISVRDVKWDTYCVNYPSTVTDYEPYNAASVSVDFDETVYGGEVDFTTGVVTVTDAIMDLGTIVNWSMDANRPGVWYGSITGRKDRSDIVSCSYYKVDNVSVTTNKDMYISGAISYGGSTLFFRDTRTTEMVRADIQTMLSGQTIVYELATPIEVTLTPQDLMMLLGDNVLTTDGKTITLTYKGTEAEQPLGLGLGSPNPSPEPEEEPVEEEPIEEPSEEEEAEV